MGFVNAFIKAVLPAVFIIVAGCESGDGNSQESLEFTSDGRVTFINYWAEWCFPCRKEIPVLNRFNNKHSKISRVVGVNFDGLQGAELKAVEERMGVKFPTLAKDPGPELGLARPGGLPVTVVVDGHGKVVTLLEGEQIMESLESALSEALAQGGTE